MGRDDEERLTTDIIELARQYGRYGYRKIAALLRHAGWHANHKKIYRIYSEEGLSIRTRTSLATGMSLSDWAVSSSRDERRLGATGGRSGF
jgi:transposase InsO family protein